MGFMIFLQKDPKTLLHGARVFIVHKTKFLKLAFLV